MISSHGPLAQNPKAQIPRASNLEKAKPEVLIPTRQHPLHACNPSCRHRIGQQCYAREHGSHPAWNPWWEQSAQACLYIQYSFMGLSIHHAQFPGTWQGSPTSEALNYFLTGRCSEKHMLCAHLSGQELQKALRLSNSSQRELLHISDYFFILGFFFFPVIPRSSCKQFQDRL